MKIKSFFNILFFTIMITLYLTLSWFAVVLLLDVWFLGTILPHKEVMAIAVLITILSGGTLNSFRTQLRLEFYKGDEFMDKHENKSNIWSQILTPYIVLLVAFAVNLLINH